MKLKFFIILILSFFLMVYGCFFYKSSKQFSKKEDLSYNEATSDSVLVGVSTDSLSYNYEHESSRELDGVASEKVVVEELAPEEGVMGSGNEFPRSTTGELFLDTISTIHETYNPTISFGKISYSIPDTMTYHKTERVVLRITKNEIDSILTSINKTTVSHNFVLVKNIRVSNIMSAELLDLSVDKSFSIKELSSKEQNVEELGYTEWQWLVKPLKSGERPLKLIIKVLVTVDGKSTLKDIPVFEKDIFVYSKPLKSVWVFFKDYWQWLLATILIPLFKYLYDKFKKKKSNE